MPAGTWAAELGLASIVGPPTDPDGVDWRVRVETSTAASWSDHPYSSVPYNDAAAATGPGWYSGDVHVHGEEEPGNSLMSTSLRLRVRAAVGGRRRARLRRPRRPQQQRQQG